MRTINNAAESIRVSDPSQAVSCQIKPKGKIFNFRRFDIFYAFYTRTLLFNCVHFDVVIAKCFDTKDITYSHFFYAKQFSIKINVYNNKYTLYLYNK